MNQRAPLLISDAFIDAYVKPYYLEAHRQYFKFDYIENILDYCRNNSINLSTAQQLAILFLYSRWSPISKTPFSDGAELLKLAIDISNMEASQDVILAQKIINQVGYPNLVEGQSILVHNLNMIRFGLDSSEYQKYEDLLRLEFSYLDNPTWATSRKNVLQNILNKQQIYMTQSFIDKFEQQARSNIEGQIQLLSETQK